MVVVLGMDMGMGMGMGMGIGMGMGMCIGICMGIRMGMGIGIGMCMGMCMVIIYLIYISLYGHYVGSSALYMCFCCSTIGVIFFLYNYIYIIFNIVPYWSRSQFICAKSIILILSGNDTYRPIRNYIKSNIYI